MKSESEKTISYQARANDWAELARQDPDAFELMRSELVNDFIQNSPTEMRQRLEGVQWKIEHARNRADSPVEAFIAISGMMWESTRQLKQQHNLLVDTYRGKTTNSLAQSNHGKILNFKRATKK